MSSASVARPGEVLPFHPSQAQYEHVARRLCRFGRVPGVKLKDLDFRVLCYLAGQQPGAFHHQYTIAEELDRGPGDGEGHAAPDAVHRALNRLRAAKLVQSDAAWEGTRSLPRRQYAPTRTCVYWLTHELCALLAAEERRRAEAAADARANPARAPEPAPEGEPPPDVSWAEPEIQKIARAFDALKLCKPCGLMEVQTLRKRMREGCTLESLWLAVAGARARVTKPDGTVWARTPFGLCFASPSHVSKTAQEGLAIRAAAERFGAAPSAPSVAAPAEQGPRSAVDASPMPAEMRSSSGSQEIIDPEPDLKTSTSEPERPEGPTRRPAGDHDARPEAGKSRAAPAASASEPRLRTATPIATPERARAERGEEHGPCPSSTPPRATTAPPPPRSARERAEVAWTVGPNPRPVLTAEQMRLDVESIFAPQGRHGETRPRGWRGPPR